MNNFLVRLLELGQRSLMAGGKKNQFWTVIFMKTHACVC